VTLQSTIILDQFTNILGTVLRGGHLVVSGEARQAGLELRHELVKLGLAHRVTINHGLTLLGVLVDFASHGEQNTHGMLQSGHPVIIITRENGIVADLLNSLLPAGGRALSRSTTGFAGAGRHTLFSG
jgi:hypothetical protein